MHDVLSSCAGEEAILVFSDRNYLTMDRRVIMMCSAIVLIISNNPPLSYGHVHGP